MHLIAPNGTKKKWDVRVQLADGRSPKIPGDRDKSVALRIGHRVEMLIRAKANGDPPPAELKAWIDNMPEVLAKRLVTLGHLDQRRVDRLKPIEEHVLDFEKVVATRKNNTAVHARRTAGCVRRLLKHMKVTTLPQITEDSVAFALATLCKTPSTRRHYVIAIKDFAKWTKNSHRAPANPLEDLKPPSQYAAPAIERVPLTVLQFRALMTHLDTFERYPHQFARWTAADRKLLYWTAVRSAFRLNELRSLRVSSVMLDAKPAQIVVNARNSKNSAKGAVPIPSDLAAALKRFIKDREETERLFPFPATNHGILDMFRRDLTGAGIKWDWGENDPQRIDFHTLRSTAITWWLDVDGLPPKRVQILARLKTLALVGLYSRNLRLEEFGWLDKGPVLVPSTRRSKRDHS